VDDRRERVTETGATITVERGQTTAPATDSTVYRATTDSDQLSLGSDVVTARHARVEDRLHAGVTIVVPGDTAVATVSVDTTEGRSTIVLPSRDFADDCWAAADGDRQAAERLTQTSIPPTRLPSVCGAVVDVTDVVALVDTVASTSYHAANQLHDYRYGVVRGALCHDAGLTVTTQSELETLVEGLDAVDQIGDVDLVPALADVMATVHDDPVQTGDLLAELGYDRHAIERRDDGLLFACRLAQLCQSRDIETARVYARERDWWLDGPHRQRVERAKRAEYGDRGETWLRLVPLAARRGAHEFAYALANALYWTGEEDRSDARLAELLFDGAVVAGEEIDLEPVVDRATYERHLGAGHRHRSNACYPPAVTHFDAAARVADTQPALLSWEPRYSRAIARANDAANTGDHGVAVGILEEAQETLSTYDIPEPRAADVRNHLDARRLEAEAARTNAPDASIEALDAAREHYTAVGFDRSVDRVERRLDRYQTQVESTTTTSEHTAASTSHQSVDATTAGHEESPAKSSTETESSTEAREASGGADEADAPTATAASDTSADGESVTADATGDDGTSKRDVDDDPFVESSVLDPTGGDRVIDPGGGDIWADPDDPADPPWDDDVGEGGGDPYVGDNRFTTE
jgi:hypothetical protein